MTITMPEKKQRPVLRPLYVLLAILLLAGIAAVYWHISGRVNLAGEVKDSVISLSPDISGVFSRIEVREGQRVGKGQPLMILDSTTQRKTLAEERQKLAQLEALLPPQYARGSGPGGYGQAQDDESMEERLARQRKEEAAAERRLQSAADNEAQAAITYNRASMLVSQGKLSARERDAAAAALEEARLATQAARAAFESRSHARSGTTAEMRRVKENQSAIGADTLPEGLRIKNYELQRERVRAAAAALEATVVRAPEDGVISEIAARPGGPATAGAPCLYMASFDKGVTVVAPATDDMAKKLRLGQQCRLEIAGASDNPYAGYISNFLPRSGAADKDAENAPPAGMRVQITITGPAGKGQTDAAKPAEGDSPALYLRGGAKAEITVLLRAPLYGESEQTPARPDTPAAPREGAAKAAPAAAPAAPPAAVPTPASLPAAPPAAAQPTASAPSATPPAVPEPSILSTPAPERPDGPDNPEGRLLPPVNPPAPQTPSPGSSQGPLDSSRSLPQLPPMRAPAQLNGSALPDPQNNPSLVTPEILEREANRER